MRIQIFSDLHLERDPSFQPHIAQDTDVVVLAGDVGSYQAGSRLKDDDFGLSRFSPLGRDRPWPRVLFVPGNHEFDGLEFEPTRERLQALCERLGIDWLDRQVLTLGGVRFMGTTLWSDFEALASAESTETRRHQALNKALRAANFYLRKNTTLVNGVPVLAEGLREWALQSQAWLRAALAEPFEGKTVVVTHFAPSLRSADPRYGLTPGTAGFCNALDELFVYADLWVHGHLHCFNDYVVQVPLGAGTKPCRVLANPLGYAVKGEQEAFRPELVAIV